MSLSSLINVSRKISHKYGTLPIMHYSTLPSSRSHGTCGYLHIFLDVLEYMFLPNIFPAFPPLSFNSPSSFASLLTLGVPSPTPVPSPPPHQRLLCVPTAETLRPHPPSLPFVVSLALLIILRPSGPIISHSLSVKDFQILLVLTPLICCGMSCQWPLPPPLPQSRPNRPPRPPPLPGLW